MTPVNGARSRTSKSSSNSLEIKKLRDTVQLIDCLSQAAFSEIALIAKLALSRLETPEGHLHFEDIAAALTAIWGRARDTEGSINYSAECVQCNHIDERRARRDQAQQAASKKESTCE